MSYLEYKDLAPINDIKGGEEYLNALNWAFKNKKYCISWSVWCRQKQCNRNFFEKK